MKRFISFFIVVVMLLSMLPTVTFATEVRTVYVDQKNGDNNNSGLTEQEAVKSVASAYSALAGADEGIIVFLSTTEFTSGYNMPKHTIPVTLTSKTGAEGIRSQSNVYFRGPTTLENITFTNYSTNAYTLLTGGGFDFVIGEGVNSVAENGCYFCLIGGSNSAAVDSVNMTVMSGKWQNIYVSAHNVNGVVTGDCTASISNCTVQNAISLGYRGSIQGNTNVTISNTTVDNIYPCSTNVSGSVGGNVTITIGNGTNAINCSTESATMATVSGKVTIILDGGQVENISKASENSEWGATETILKSGTVTYCQNATDTCVVDIPEGKTLTLNGNVTANSLKSAGTLVFGSAASLTAAAVTGTVNCTVTGDVLPGHVYLKAPAGSQIFFDETTGVLANNDQWTLGGTYVDETFTGLVLMAKPDVTVNLYTGYEDGELLTPDKTVTSELINAYYYDISSGAYRYKASGTGYFKIEKIVYMSEAEASSKTVVNATPPVKSGKGWEQTSLIQQYSDEVLNGAQNSDISQWPEYADVFTTPWFTEEHAEHQMTTQDQLEAFIDKLDDENDNLYVFNAGESSKKHYPIDAVVVTKSNLSAAKSLEDAAKLIDKTKPTILYRAHMHGNEPASGEGALAILQRLDGTLGEKVLDKINLVVIPRNNPDGASTYTRDVINELDPNHDLLNVTCKETEAYLRVYNLFVPEIVLDGHEFTTDITKSSFTNVDAMIGYGFTLENSETFKENYRPLDAELRSNLSKNGLNYSYYTSIVNNNGAYSSRGHSSYQGTMFVLIETKGIRSGTTAYARRVVTQAIAIQTVIEHVAENAASITAVVAAERQRIVNLGSTYEETDEVLLELEATSDSSWMHPSSTTTQSGTIRNTTKTPTVWNTVVRSRIAPTAYVIPAGESYTQQVLDLMDKHEIKYTFIPAGSSVMLQQYYGTFADSKVTDVTLGQETGVTFENGAYVFCKNQVRGILLSAIMEPDVTKSMNSTLVLRGILPNENGTFPLYRYCHDLNENGFIDYIAGETEPIALTVYVDTTNGDDNKDGLTEANSVKTLDRAYTLLDSVLRVAADGSTGTIIISGKPEFDALQNDLLTANYPVTIEGKNADAGILFAGNATQDEKFLKFNNDITFENISITTNGSNIVLDLNGHDLKGNPIIDGRLFFMDSQTNDYDVSDEVYGKLPTGLQNVAAAEGYIMADEEEGISFHKVDTEIDGAYFSPTKAGLYYSSLFKGDEFVKKNIKTFGVALSITAVPTVDSNGFADHCLYSTFEQDLFDAGNEKEFVSTILKDILSDEYGIIANRKNAATTVYGRSYIQFEDGTYLLSESNGITLQEAVEYADGVWDQLTTPQQNAILDLYDRFPVVFDVWDIPEIKKAKR